MLEKDFPASGTLGICKSLVYGMDTGESRILGVTDTYQGGTVATCFPPGYQGVKNCWYPGYWGVANP